MIGEEILLEIDKTLDQLICNAEVLQTVPLKTLSETELEAFQKTQESLLHRLIHMDELLETKRKGLSFPDRRSAAQKIQTKLAKFERLKGTYHKSLAQTLNRKTSLFSKRRNKRFLGSL